MSEKKFPKLSLWREDVERCISDAEACIDACDGHAEDDMSSLFLNVISLEEHAHLMAAKDEETKKWKDEYENVCKFATDYEQRRDALKEENKRLREALEDAKAGFKTLYYKFICEDFIASGISQRIRRIEEALKGSGDA